MYIQITDSEYLGAWNDWSFSTIAQQRRKRSPDSKVAATRTSKSANKSRVHVYESFEAKKTGTPKRNVVTESIHKARIIAVPPPEDFNPDFPVSDPPPRRRGKGIYRRPGFSKDRSEERGKRIVAAEAAEAEDLADDSFFFAQLRKDKKKKKSKKNRKAHPGKKHAGRHDEDVVLVHGAGSSKSERTRAVGVEDEAQDYLENGNEAEFVDQDYYDNGDYAAAEVESEKADVEEIEAPVGRVKTRRKQKAKKHGKRFHYTEIVSIHPDPRPAKKAARPEPVHKIHHTRTSRIVETKKFHDPERLYSEIDKILDMKQRNYEKRGHDKTHWELRIIPRRYEDYDYNWERLHICTERGETRSQDQDTILCLPQHVIKLKLAKTRFQRVKGCMTESRVGAAIINYSINLLNKLG